MSLLKSKIIQDDKNIGANLGKNVAERLFFDIERLEHTLIHHSPIQYSTLYKSFLEKIEAKDDFSILQAINVLFKRLSMSSSHPLVLSAREIATKIDQGLYHHAKAVYHSKLHYFEVMLGCYLLAKAHNHLAPEKLLLTDEDILLLTVTGLIHDLDHPGGVPATAFAHEEHSFTVADTYFRKHQLNAFQSEQIYLLLIGSEAFQGHPYLKTLYRRKFHQEELGFTPSPEWQQKLDAFTQPKHEKTLMMAAILLDADIFYSTCISLEAAKHKSALLEQEFNFYQGPAQYLQFTDVILLKHLCSLPGQRFQNIFEGILQEATACFTHKPNNIW